MRKKLKAFTLMELLVSMLISGIVISIIYVCYEIIYKQYDGYKKTNGEITQALILNTLLKNDFSEAHVVLNGDNELLFEKDKSRIVYEFEEGFILRTAAEVTDTFFVPSNEIRVNFQREKQQEPSGLVDELVFDANVLDEPETFHFKKIYGSDVLMEYEKQREKL